MSEHRYDEASGSRRWLLRGAALGIAAAGGVTIANAPDAQATSLSGIANWLNVRDAPYNAQGDGVTDDTNAFTQALAAANSLGGTTVLVPPGTYIVNGPLEMYTGTRLAGASQTSSIIKQTATSGPLLHSAGQRYMSVTDLQLLGPGTGTGQGIVFDDGTAAVAGLEFRNVHILNFGGDAVLLNVPITSTFTNVRCEVDASVAASGYAFHVLGGTSLVFNACYAVGVFKTGYYLDSLHYASLLACAADSTNQAYYLNNCEDVTLTGCGCESNTIGASPYGGYGFVVNNGLGNSLNGCRIYRNASVGFWMKGNSIRTTLTSCTEMDPAATSQLAFKVDSGSTAILTNCGWGTVNGGSFAAGTSCLIGPNAPIKYF